MDNKRNCISTCHSELEIEVEIITPMVPWKKRKEGGRKGGEGRKEEQEGEEEREGKKEEQRERQTDLGIEDVQDLYAENYEMLVKEIKNQKMEIYK